MAEDRADTFLRMIRRSQRGRLKLYLGYSAGVGKTYQMLQDGHRLKNEGIDVVVGLLETHGRAEIAKLAEGLETVPRRRLEYHGVPVEEMDVDAIVARKPRVVLIDELAHTNVPGSRNPKRYQDVQDVLAEGIHVITTMNVQHLESLYNIVESAVGVRVRERLPDSVLAEADQIVDVDLTTEDLRQRLEEGKIYPAERIETALANFFTPPNLEKLRELTLRELASQIDLRRREISEDETAAGPDQIMVCLSSRGTNSELLLRYASRLAGKLNRNWYAVYVQTPSEEATVIDARTQRFLSDTLTLAKQLGALVFTYKGEDVADTILRFAREYRVGHIIIGRSTPKPAWRRLGRNTDVAGDVIRHAKGITVIVVDTRKEDLPATVRPVEAPEETEPAPGIPAAAETAQTAPERPRLSPLLSRGRIVIWDEPVDKETVLRTLARAAAPEGGIQDADALFAGVMKREGQGSTFFNEGVAFPHVRIPGLAQPAVALGLTRRGVSDVPTEKPIRLVFLILSPAETPDLQVRILGLASRAAQSRHLTQRLETSGSPEEALDAIREWEIFSESSPAHSSS
jgi:two-component system sensor histidine kinase KdpD